MPANPLPQPDPPPLPLGFPQHGKPDRPAPVAKPKPLPHRPKGRWFVGALLLACCAFAGYQVWNTFFRYRAHGVITGRVVTVSPPWEGMVQGCLVREGDRVRQGQLLLTVDNLELRQRVAQVGDEIRLAQANLDAEVARLKWQLAFNLDQARGAEVMYYEAWGQLLQDQARLEDLRSNLYRARLMQKSAISREELDAINYSVEGLEQKIAQSRQALAELRKRAGQTASLLHPGMSLSEGLAAGGAEQLRPAATRIEALLAERARLQERLDQGQVCSPVNGLVLKVHHFAGERCPTSSPLVSILEEGSLQVVLYLPQGASNRWAPGDELGVLVDPYPRPLPCTLTRLGDQYEPAPESIKRYYPEAQKLLPAYLEPKDELLRYLGLRVGGTVKLPYDWPDFWQGIWK
ncbi:MAG TPA: biotin/lipoyl-binding protein [Gemmataceae bacterium]|nr:biotin/lipoyl-binding protein [Gemmataceae bacterium]